MKRCWLLLLLFVTCVLLVGCTNGGGGKGKISNPVASSVDVVDVVDGYGLTARYASKHHDEVGLSKVVVTGRGNLPWEYDTVDGYITVAIYDSNHHLCDGKVSVYMGGDLTSQSSSITLFKGNVAVVEVTSIYTGGTNCLDANLLTSAEFIITTSDLEIHYEILDIQPDEGELVGIP